MCLKNFVNYFSASICVNNYFEKINYNLIIFLSEQISVRLLLKTTLQSFMIDIKAFSETIVSKNQRSE